MSTTRGMDQTPYSVSDGQLSRRSHLVDCDVTSAPRSRQLETHEHEDESESFRSERWWEKALDWVVCRQHSRSMLPPRYVQLEDDALFDEEHDAHVRATPRHSSTSRNDVGRRDDDPSNPVGEKQRGTPVPCLVSGCDQHFDHEGERNVHIYRDHTFALYGAPHHVNRTQSEKLLRRLPGH
ncbi:hypothetical protein BV25DRAFT_945655 [Artomyces pyxidatus]|uniref:Uncharacterized protein n=1 Tax=Artomyces pyxidatus TaxID=48021 RepID=A0ACB8SWJ8_9AGAM|nr:hypothetical protein BV25DRAFT_945655 [Artomyces pyxidatus]